MHPTCTAWHEDTEALGRVAACIHHTKVDKVSWRSGQAHLLLAGAGRGLQLRGRLQRRRLHGQRQHEVAQQLLQPHGQTKSNSSYDGHTFSWGAWYMPCTCK